MDPTTIHDITTILSSGGNVAAMVGIYIGFKVLTEIRTFLTSIETTMKSNIETNQRVIALLERRR